MHYTRDKDFRYFDCGVALTFEEETHTYRVNDAVVPSVTQLIGTYIGDRSKQFYKEEHAERGRFVHAITAHMDNTLDLTCPSQFQGYKDAYDAFLTEHSPRILASEQMVFSPRYWYAGRVDRWVEVAGTEGVLDIKTGKPKPDVELQLAAYAVGLIEAEPQTDGFSLELRKDGSFDLKHFDLADAIHVWRGLCRLHKWRKKNDKTLS